MKRAKLITTTATLVTSLGIATGVHAEEIEPQLSASESQSNQENSVMTLDDLNQAETNLNAATQAVTSQESKVLAATLTADEARQAYEETVTINNGIQELVDDINSEDIQEANADVLVAQEQVEQAEMAKEAASQAVNQLEEAIESQKQNVLTAQEGVSEAQKIVEQAQHDVDVAQAELDKTGQEVILDEVEKAIVAESEQKAKVDEAESALKVAQEADVKRQETIDNAQKTVDESIQNVATKEAELNNKELILDEVTRQLVQAQEALATSENDYDAVNTIKMSAEYAKALKDAYDYSLSKGERDAAYEVLESLARTEASNNEFVHNDNDKTRAFDISTVTLEQAEELSLFAADLINQARQAVGSLLVEVTSEAASEAQEQAERYAASDFTLWTLHHDMDYLNDKYYWVDEDWYGSLGYRAPQNIDEAKSWIYRAIVGWLFASDEWLHASSVAGTRNATEGDSYVGVGLSKLKDGTISINLNIFNTLYSDLTNFDQEVLDNLKSNDSVTSAYESAKAKVEMATAQYDLAAKRLSDAQLSYDAAVVELTKNLEAFEDAKSVPIQTPNAQDALSTAQSAYAEAVNRLTKANQALANLTTDIQEKQNDFNEAKQFLADSEDNLQSRQAALTKTIKYLTNLEATLVATQENVIAATLSLDESKEILEQAKEHLAFLENLSDLLAEAKYDKEAARVNLLQALADLEAELTLLKELQIKQAVAQTIYDVTLQKYQDNLISQTKQDLLNEYDYFVNPAERGVNAVNSNEKNSFLADGTSEVISLQNRKLPKLEDAILPSKDVLPNTGENNYGGIVLVGGLMYILGLVGIRKKRYENI